MSASRMRVEFCVKKIIVAFFLASASVFGQEKQTFESKENQTTLVELFTSEGCSSCPPADAWISRLKTNGDLWTKIVPVAFHVDYWDRLGWRDRFAKPEFTARQQGYGAEWKSDSIYTPAFVTNGREWRHWSESATPPIAASVNVGKLSVTLEESRKVVAHFVAASQSNESLQLNIALLGSNLESKVGRGENSGRKLHHEFVALALMQVTLQRRTDEYFAEIILPNEQLSDKPAALAAWINSAQRKPPLQATGGWLKP